MSAGGVPIGGIQAGGIPLAPVTIEVLPQVFSVQHLDDGGLKLIGTAANGLQVRIALDLNARLALPRMIKTPTEGEAAQTSDPQNGV